MSWVIQNLEDIVTQMSSIKTQLPVDVENLIYNDIVC